MKKQEFCRVIKFGNLPLIFKYLEYDEVGVKNGTLNIKVSKSRQGTLMKHNPNYKLISRVFYYDNK